MFLPIFLVLPQRFGNTRLWVSKTGGKELGVKRGLNTDTLTLWQFVAKHFNITHTANDAQLNWQHVVKRNSLSHAG